MPTKLSVELAPRHPTGLLLANPVMTASGTFGYGTEYSHLFDIQRLGAIVSKGTTLKPREGNPQPRIAETACGVLNAIGLQNIGAEALIEEKAPVWAGWQVPVISYEQLIDETVDHISTARARILIIKTLQKACNLVSLKTSVFITLTEYILFE